MGMFCRVVEGAHGNPSFMPSDCTATRGCDGGCSFTVIHETRRGIRYGYYCYDHAVKFAKRYGARIEYAKSYRSMNAWRK